MDITIPDDLTPAGRALVDDLLDSRAREFEVLGGLSPRQLLAEQDRTIEPPLWEVGHVGWFQERWILRRLGGSPPIWDRADALYDSFTIPNVARWDLAFPAWGETIEYITDVLERVIGRLGGRDPSPEETYFYRLATNHEDMHSETMVHIRQTLGYPQPEIVTRRAAPPLVDLDYQSLDVAIPGGVYQLGATPDMPFVFDNEKWAHPVELAPFQIHSTPVTTGEYRVFVEAGGYLERAFWSEEGWTWRRVAGAEQPAFWLKQADGSWCQRWFDGERPLRPFLPMMHVNFYEAEAYCRWAGRRLPTEAEWEVAASAGPDKLGGGFTDDKPLYPWGNLRPTAEQANLDSAALGPVDVRALPAGDSAFGCRQMIGNVWEWTADTFESFPGFVIDPYDTYSAPSFGQQKVLRGGSWVTRGRVIRNTYRNFYTPNRNNIFAGFRTVAL